jgi:regulator of cell morphogenesis and NO signaling
MNMKKILDVRAIDKRFRKKIILNLFSELEDNHQLELISDHSLAPLRMLFQKEMSGFFEWQELENGPEIWKNSIKKVKSFTLTLNELIRKNPYAVGVLEKYGIPYYKKGTEKLGDITEHAQSIFMELRELKNISINPLRTDYWPVHFTVDYIVNNHHAYVREMIPEIESLIDHLVKVHASTHPQLPMISKIFSEFKAELEEHMKDEEETVFPSFKALEYAVLSRKASHHDSFDDSINWMEEDHMLTGASLKSMRHYCNNYVAPEDSSPGFKILYDELRKFESDMLFHMHLENNVLFQKVLDLLNSPPQS